MGILVYIYFAIVAVNLFFILRYFFPFAFSRQTEKTLEEFPPVSIIIAARNEASNLVKNLPSIIDQDYSAFEVIVVNDRSDDETFDLLRKLSAENSRLKVVTVDRVNPMFQGKKFALTMGIKAAKNQRLLFTDADCKPKSKFWIKEMISASMDRDVILGYGAYEKRKGFLNRMVRYETALTGLTYFSFAKAGIPYMGVGRNLSYTKELFFSVNGFVNHQHILSGDDDLFIRDVATKKNTAYSTAEDSFTYSTPVANFKEWWTQKRRHYSTGRLYKPGIKFRLGLFNLSNVLIYIGLAVYLLLGQPPLYGGIAFLVRFLLLFLLNHKVYKMFKEKGLLTFLPILDFLYCFFLVLQGLMVFKKKRTKWK